MKKKAFPLVLLVPARYEYVYGFSGGAALVSADKKRGYIDRTGKEITAAEYDGGTASRRTVWRWCTRTGNGGT